MIDFVIPIRYGSLLLLDTAIFLGSKGPLTPKQEEDRTPVMTKGFSRKRGIRPPVQLPVQPTHVIAVAARFIYVILRSAYNTSVITLIITTYNTINVYVSG